LNDMEVKSFGSQGQQRTSLLSIKLAELEIFKEVFGEYPILLLDDVFSELDEKRKKRLFDRVQNVQTIITTTKFDMPNQNANIIKIENGKIVI
ncbi:MAG: DNA replication and repair protein RecF, partial [Christensenellales bacterium]